MRVDIPKLKLSMIIAATAVMLCISLSFILTKPINEKNTILVNGHYDKIERVIAKGDVSYNLYIKESDDFYKIAADNSDCFYSDSFQNAKGQLIQIYLRDSFWRRPMIVCIVANSKVYLSFDCSNQEIEKEKVTIPLICIVITFLISILIYKKELSKVKFK